MKKLIVILSLSIFLTGCQVVADTAGETEASEIVESTEKAMLVESESNEEIFEEVAEDVFEEAIGEVSEEGVEEVSEESIGEVSEEAIGEVSEEAIQDDSEETGEEKTTEEEETESYYQKFYDELDYTVTVLDEHMEITDKVPASDLVTLQCGFYEENESAIFFAYVEDGKLHYLREMNRGYLYYSGQDNSMEIFPEISNIRRMKTFNAGSGVEPMPVLITESGEVYMLYNTWPRYSDEMELVHFTLLEDYQVEDILYYDGEWSYHMKVLLKDGSVIELQSESWG